MLYALTQDFLRTMQAAASKPLPAIEKGVFTTWCGVPVAHPETWAARGAPRSAGDIAIIPIMGALSLRGSYFGMSVEGIRAAFQNKLDDPSVRAIVLQFDSPGGEVFGIDEFATELRAARATKPVVAVSDPFAASAAYYLAAQATEIMVSPSAMVGSIGVYAGHMDWSGALEQMGIKVTLISAGEGKTDGNEFEPLSDEARADIQADIDRYYAMFVGAVAKGRKVSVETVRSTWKAKVYGAKDAAEIKMADAVGTFDDAIRRAASLSSDRRAAAAAVDREVEYRQRSRR